ncbi:MAG: DUF4411 family protein [Ignavibacteriales bacterium]|nr:DUF4411 family protein [Ignavibacteriales bacterium]
MIYVFDTNALSNILNHYYANNFPSFWERFDQMIKSKNSFPFGGFIKINQRFGGGKKKRIMNENIDFFTNPNVDELNFVTKIYSVTHFQQNLDKKKILSGGFFADPFVISKAYVNDACIITEEENKPNAAKIPNICHHFNIDCKNFEGFLNENSWKF